MAWKRPSRMSDAELDAYIAKRIGDFLAIPLDNQFGFGRIVHRGKLAVYDLLLPMIPPVSDIAAAKVLFVVGVYLDEYSTRRWKTIGNAPPEDFLMQPRKLKRTDPITGKVDIYFDGNFFPVTDEDLDKLEVLAVWSYMNVEMRLRKHFGLPPLQIGKKA